MVDLTATTPWRRTAVFPEYRDRSLSEVFHELALACADRVAVRDGERSLTYRELHASIECVATAVRERRNEPDDAPWVVTGVIGHGIEALVTVYGVMAAGAVLVPIDAGEPVERIAGIHHAGGAGLVVSTAAHPERVREATGLRAEVF